MTPESDTAMAQEIISGATSAAVFPIGNHRYGAELDMFTHVNARAAQHSFEMFRKTVSQQMLWNPFVLRITRELQRFGGG
jgi:hypothetical protein